MPKDDTETEVEESNDFSELNASLHSKTYVSFLAIKQKLVYQVIELWNRVMSVSYVFSLVAMMVSKNYRLCQLDTCRYVQ